MKAIHALIPAHRVPKVVLAMQATGLFPVLTLTEARRIGPDASPGIGKIADRLMDPAPYSKLELVCADEEAEQLRNAILSSIDEGKDGTWLYSYSVESPKRSSP